MKFRYWLIFVVSIGFVFAAAPPAKKISAKKTTGAKTTATKKTATAKRRRVAAGPGVAANSWRSRQQAPTPERYKEIQQALTAKGYLKTEPNGVWDADSADALRRFQTDQKLSPTGKINAPSLIGLGLGGSAAPEPSVTPAHEGPATEPGPQR